MIVVRAVRRPDAAGLEVLSHVPGIFNLPSDLDLLEERIDKSQGSFAGRFPSRSDNKFTFVAEDTETGEILGTSMVAAQHGTPESPHTYFEVGREERYSTVLASGFIHGTLTLKTMTDGPSEIGALVVQEKARARPERIGRQLSMARFLYVALHLDRFQPEMIAELLPPLNKKGQSPLWEAIGRRFTNMDYWEADRMAAQNKDFIFELFPTGKIYTTFLPAEARNAIGKIGKDTLPVQHLLERIGFKYGHHIDPFDGGPHFWARLADLTIVRALRRGTYARFGDGGIGAEGEGAEGLLTRTGGEGDFVAVHAVVTRGGPADPLTVVGDAARVEAALDGLKPGDPVAFVPYR